MCFQKVCLSYHNGMGLLSSIQAVLKSKLLNKLSQGNGTTEVNLVWLKGYFHLRSALDTQQLLSKCLLRKCINGKIIFSYYFLKMFHSIVTFNTHDNHVIIVPNTNAKNLADETVETNGLRGGRS